ncbi:MAG: hypothetical protein GY751_15510 [Bacteroidetes bacterium]|nr:hypothetical protein [Bacteroidota bacterium]
MEISVDGGDFFEANNLGLSLSGKKIDWVYYLDLNGVIDGSNIVSAHTISARAVDIWDNATSTEIMINVDNTLPAIPVAELSNLPRLIGDGTAISVTVGGENVVAYRYRLDEANWTAEIDVVGNPTINVSGLGQGEHTLLVAAKSGDGVWQDPFAGATEYSWSINTRILFTASVRGDVDFYGCRVAISSDGLTIVTGATETDAIGSRSGAAYIYKWTGSAWEETKLTASDGTAQDLFGDGVSISSDGNTIVIGAVGDDDKGSGSGSIYVYKWNGSSWAETKIIASGGAANDYLGPKLSISSDGGTIAAGMYAADDKGDMSGAAYIFKWNGSSWVEERLSASDGAANDRFGASVSVSSDGSKIIVGASSDSDKGSYSGSIYIYQWNGSEWTETKLTASDGAASDYFGSSVSTSSDGNRITVGAWGDADKGANSGSVYVFNWDGSNWEESKLTASDGAPGDNFGNAVLISSDGNTIIVSSPADDDKGDNSGSVYIYKWNGSSWDETSKLTAFDGEGSDLFGCSIATTPEADVIIVGAFGHDTNKGAFYFFYQ